MPEIPMLALRYAQLQQHRTTPPPGRRRRTEPLGDRAVRWLSRYSIGILRISLGLIFLGFGVPKFFPGVSPAEGLVTRTLDTLTFGVITGTTALVLTAVVECFIGLTLITGRWLRAGLVVLGGAMVGILSPLVLFFAARALGASLVPDRA
jgi:uncharacterized membrane protein YphA (DoxX/SURF4 family)